MKSVMKKLLAGATACLCMLSAMTGCYSESKSWSAKRGDDTSPVGVYIYYLSSAYSEALGKVEDRSKSVFDQKIDGMDGAEWVKDCAKKSIQLMYYTSQRFDELGLKMDKDDQAQVDSLTSSAWTSSKNYFDQYGIAQASVEKAYSEFIVKYRMVFEAVYGKGGEKEVSDADLRAFYEKKYTDFDYFICSYSKPDKKGVMKPMPEKEKAAAKKEFEGYVTKIQNGELTMKTAADAYKKSVKQEQELLQNLTTDLNEKSMYMPKELTAKLKSIGEGEVAYVDLPESNQFYIIQKNSISKKFDEVTKDTDGRMNVLVTMKNEEFSDAMEKAAETVEDITYNDAAINSYNPDMFFNEKDLVSSSTSSESSSSSSSK